MNRREMMAAAVGAVAATQLPAIPPVFTPVLGKARQQGYTIYMTKAVYDQLWYMSRVDDPTVWDDGEAKDGDDRTIRPSTD